MPVTPQVTVRTAAQVTDAERAALYQLWDRAFPQAPGRVRSPDFAEPATLGLLLRDGDGGLIGACRLRERTIRVADEPARVAGLASVAIVEACRGRGYGRWLVGLAADTARVHGYAWSVLFCSPWRRDYYGRLGWQTLEGRLLVGPPGAADPIDPAETAVMALPLTRGAAGQAPAWRAAPVHLPDYW